MVLMILQYQTFLHIIEKIIKISKKILNKLNFEFKILTFEVFNVKTGAFLQLKNVITNLNNSRFLPHNFRKSFGFWRIS